MDRTIMKKLQYQAPEIRVIAFLPQDIITVSDGSDSSDSRGVNLPLDPAKQQIDKLEVKQN